MHPGDILHIWNGYLVMQFILYAINLDFPLSAIVTTAKEKESERISSVIEYLKVLNI